MMEIDDDKDRDMTFRLGQAIENINDTLRQMAEAGLTVGIEVFTAWAIDTGGKHISGPAVRAPHVYREITYWKADN